MVFLLCLPFKEKEINTDTVLVGLLRKLNIGFNLAIS